MINELLDYFNGDELSSSVWLNKYAQEGDKTPDDMHKRMSKEFARIEEKYQKEESEIKKNSNDLVFNQLSRYGYDRIPLTEELIYNLFKDFKYIIPQGSIMSQLGNASIGSLSNCFVIGQPEDSYGGIFQKDEEMVQLMKRRGGVGIDISTLRPKETAVSNAAKTTTGAVSFMHRFSNSTREVAQNGRRGALMLSISCFSKNTMILTDLGWINILNLFLLLSTGKEIYAISEDGNKNKIINPFITEPEPLYLIELEDGSTIETTSDHKFEVKNIVTGEIYLKALKDIDCNLEEFKIIEVDES